MNDLSKNLPTPPAVLDELETGPPDFVGIGAQKAATSYWQHLILQHPKVYSPIHFKDELTPSFLFKERHFFDRFFDRQLSPEDRQDFYQWFPRPRGMLTGEWTPRYSIEHWAPSLLKQLAPDTKILMIVRDPIERFVSGMRHRLRKNVLTANDGHVSYLRGMYALQLEIWQRSFDPRQFLILQYEQCVRDVTPHLKRTYEFLGLDNFIPSEKAIAKPRNVTKKLNYDLSEEHRQSLIDAYSSDVARLPSFFPDFDPSLWPSFRGVMS